MGRRRLTCQKLLSKAMKIHHSLHTPHVHQNRLECPWIAFQTNGKGPQLPLRVQSNGLISVKVNDRTFDAHRLELVWRGMQSNPVDDGLEKQSGSRKTLASLKLSTL